jgi:1-acyl-sn-glycerol-3-phosphate acyltransferase
MIRAVSRFLTIVTLIALYLAGACIIRVVWKESSSGRHKVLALMQTLSQWALRFLGFKVKRSGCLDHLVSDAPSLIVSNHLSWLDILVIASIRPTVFVTSVEIRDSGFLGMVCKLAGCHFVERRSRSNIGVEVEKMAETLREGFAVGLFPEGTTSNGAAVLPFKVSLFDAAIAAGVPVQPVCLNYLTIDGRSVDIESGRRLFWYGDMEFLPHLWALMFVDHVEVEVTVLDPVAIDHGVDRKALAGQAWKQISTCYIQMA